MKTYIFVLLSYIMSNSLYGQIDLVNVSNNFQLYKDVPNTFEIIIDDFYCDSFIFVSNNGTLRKENCQLEITPTSFEDVTITCSKTNQIGTTPLKQFSFSVIPYYITISIAHKTDGDISKHVLMAQEGIGIHDKLNFQLRYNIRSATFNIYRDNKCIFVKNIKSNTFDSQVKKAITKCNPGDIILIYDVKIETDKGGLLKTHPLELHVI